METFANVIMKYRESHKKKLYNLEDSTSQFHK